MQRKVSGVLAGACCIILNATTSSVRAITFHPDAVRLVVRGAPPGGRGCASRSSTSASKAPTGVLPTPAPSAMRTRVVVQPSRFWSVFDCGVCFRCYQHNFTESTHALSSMLTWTSPRKKVRQPCVKQKSGCTSPFAYANSFDARHSKKYDNARPNHITSPPSWELVTVRYSWAKIDHVSGNLTCAFFLTPPGMYISLFLLPRSYSAKLSALTLGTACGKALSRRGTLWRWTAGY